MAIQSRLKSTDLDKTQKFKQQPIQKITNPTKAQLAGLNDLGMIADKANKKLHIKVDNVVLTFTGVIA